MPVSMRLSMTRQKRLDLVIIVVSLALVGLYDASGGGGFPLDDSWIHQGYARSLAERGEWSLVPGAASAAATSPLYVMLLAIGYKLGIAYALWTLAIGAAALVLLVMLLARMSAWLLAGRERWRWLPPALTLGTWHLIWSAAAGMETIVFCTLTTALLYWAWRFCSRRSSSLCSRHAVSLGLLSGLVTLTRPEGLLLGGLVLASVIASEVARVYRATPLASDGKLQPGQGGATAVVSPKYACARLAVFSSVALLTFAVIVVPFAHFNWTITGSVLPASASAKLQQHQILLGTPFATRILSLLAPVFAGAQILVLPGLAFYIGFAARGRFPLPTLAAILPIFWAAALVMLYAARLPAAYQHGRYLIPLLPPTVLCGGIGLAYAQEYFRNRCFSRVLSRSWLGATLTCGVVFTLAVGPGVFRQDVAIVNEEMVRTAKWIRANIAEDDSVAGHDIGAFGYFAGRAVLDLAGLLTPDVIPLWRDAEALWSLLESRGIEVLYAFPDQIPGGSSADRRLCRIFSTEGRAARAAGGQNMSVYRLDWRGGCLPEG